MLLLNTGKHNETSYDDIDGYAYSRDGYCLPRNGNALVNGTIRYREEEDTTRQKREVVWLKKHNNRHVSDFTPKYLSYKRQSSEPSDFDLLLSDGIGGASLFESGLPEEQKEHIRCSLVRREKDFVHVERIEGRDINILQGLELHQNVFNAEEQRNIVKYVYKLQKMAQNGQFKGMCIELLPVFSFLF